MRRVITLLVLLFSFSILESFSQDLGIPYFDLSYRRGRLLESSNSRSKINDRAFYEVIGSIGFQTQGTKHWQRFYNYPRYGVKFGYTHYFDNRFGHNFSIVPYLDLPIYRASRFSFWSSFGFGLAYFTDHFDPIKNPINDYVSRTINVSIDLSLSAEYKISKYIDVFTGIGISHYSNGATSYPNLGINKPMLSAGIRVHKDYNNFVTNLYDYPKRDESDMLSKNEIYVFIAPGQMYGKVPPGKYIKTWGGTMQFGYKRRFSPYLRWGAGIDIVYNGREKYFFDESQRTELKNLSQAFFGTFEILFNKLSLHVGVGYYTLYSIKPRGRIYQRFGTYYHINNRHFVGVSLKSNQMSAEYIEWTYGFKIKTF